MCIELSKMIKSSKFNPDAIVGISRGGLIPARILSDLLGVYRMYTISLRSYSGNKKLPKPTLDIYCNYPFVGKSLLVVDDVADTGESLTVVKEYLLNNRAKEIRFATLHYKPNSSFMPEYFVGITSDWVVYPWEREEAKGYE